MPHIQVPPDAPGIRGRVAVRPEGAPPIAALTVAPRHAANSLSTGERELLAARVSAGNACTFCPASHAAIAACDFDCDTFAAHAVAGPEEASIFSPRLKAPLAAHVRESGQFLRAEDATRAREAKATSQEITPR